jgi:hypothetical protein
MDFRYKVGDKKSKRKGRDCRLMLGSAWQNGEPCEEGFL